MLGEIFGYLRRILPHDPCVRNYKREVFLYAERPRSGTGYRRRAFDCGLMVVAAEIISTRSG
jgi:hypothetical protein